MNKTYYILIVLLIQFSLIGCRKSEPKEEAVSIGVVNVDLNASEELIRKNEALIGNFVCDAIFEYVSNKGIEFDVVVFNSGGIRFDPQERPSGIYPAGTFYSTYVSEMLPFGNNLVVVYMTGEEIYQMFERSVAQLPDAKGPFLQVSNNVSVTIDSLGAPQLINLDETAIVSQGSRIIDIRVNQNTIDLNIVYKVVMTDFLANGNDGFVTMKNILSSRKNYLEDVESNAITDYVIINSPVEVQITDRLIYQ